MKMLRTIRKSRGLTMKELGKIVGVSESAISQYETGKREADFETLLRLGEALGCSVDQLLREESVDVYSVRFRKNLSDEMSLIDPSSFSCEPDVMADYEALEKVVEGIAPLSLADACSAADTIGESMDYLLRDSSEDAEGIKKSPDTDDAVSGDAVDAEINRLLLKLRSDQRGFVLALLRTLVEEGQESPLSAQELSSGTTVQSPN